MVLQIIRLRFFTLWVSNDSGRRVADRNGRVARSTHFENTPQNPKLFVHFFLERISFVIQSNPHGLKLGC